MQLGVNTILFGGFDLPTAFAQIANCGYDGVEISAIEVFGEKHLILDRWREIVPEINALAMQYDLPVIAMEQPSRDPQRMEKAFEAAVAMGCPVINCGPGGESDNDASLQETIDSLGRLADRAAHFGVTLCVKAHVTHAVYNTPTSLQILEAIQSPAFGLDMDPSHILRAGENPVEALEVVIGRVGHVHIRDCPSAVEPGPGAPELQACGRGAIDLFGYVRVLHESGLDVAANLEIINAKDYTLPQVVAIASESWGYLNACLRACGARS